jgi:DNA repair exonuclease SbcCD ATPase subunit
MKIVQLTAENIKRLTAVQITPQGNLVAITGKNGQGKTSVLDAIWWALAGKENIQASPIRKGQNKARVELKLGDLTVERRFTRVEEGSAEFNTSLIVTNAEGAKYPSPQTMLDALLGELAFDPLGFMKMHPVEQREVFKRFVTEDLDGIDAEQKRDYDRRTDINRRAKELQTLSGGLSPGDDLAARVDEQAILTELEQAGKRNTELANLRAQINSAITSAKQTLATAKEQEDRAAELEEEARELRDRAAINHSRGTEALANAEKEGAALPLQTVTLDLRKKYDDAVQHNDKVKEQERRMKAAREAQELEAQAAQLTQVMTDRATFKAECITKAKLPIEGLSLDEKFVLFNGVPLSQASDAEQLRISVAIAATLNPKLRVIRVRDGSLLDEDGLKLLGDFAEANDMQVWVERVDSSGAVGFVIEDGHLKV